MSKTSYKFFWSPAGELKLFFYFDPFLAELVKDSAYLQYCTISYLSINRRAVVTVQCPTL